MKEKNKIKIADFIKSLAGMTLETSVLGKERGSKKNIEKAGQFKLVGSNITELLVAELFISQLSLNKFLKSKNRVDLLDLYFSEIYHLILDKYKYFKSIEGLKLFEALIQQRFPEYFRIFDNPTDAFAVFSKAVFGNLTNKESVWPLFPNMFRIIISNNMMAIDGFIKEASEKFEIEINI